MIDRVHLWLLEPLAMLKIKIKKPKPRRSLPPPSKIHRDRKQYHRSLEKKRLRKELFNAQKT